MTRERFIELMEQASDGNDDAARELLLAFPAFCRTVGIVREVVEGLEEILCMKGGEWELLIGEERACLSRLHDGEVWVEFTIRLPDAVKRPFAVN